ncbi:MAG TPA: RloB family protein [Aromatoleum sp.]|uniref:RloB family protein n=1 Tax=Aromatoleum sp. TaxID=2307007 RepID=UPI002B461DD5|nr:RloB family protein [Aromatoleum sp.]HJV28672.1 RloB family protein [Aromatoleum sp.]
MSAERNALARLKRPPRDFSRKADVAPPRARILIVCEGEKTEPNYFFDLLDDCRLTAADVRVVGKECDSAPISVVDHAEKECGARRFERVFCVFDRDRHESFDEAIRKIRSLRDNKFRAIVSYPCFEYWLLLHFKYTRKGYVARGKNSPGTVLETELSAEFERVLGVPYKKGAEGIYRELKKKMNFAAKNAALASSDAGVTEELNPSTEILELINYLRSESPDRLEPLPL